MTDATSTQVPWTASGWGWNITTIRFLHTHNKQRTAPGWGWNITIRFLHTHNKQRTAPGWGWNITIRFLHTHNREQLQDGAETSPPSDFFTPTTNREQIQDGAETSPSDFFTPTHTKKSTAHATYAFKLTSSMWVLILLLSIRGHSNSKWTSCTDANKSCHFTQYTNAGQRIFFRIQTPWLWPWRQPPKLFTRQLNQN